MYLSQLILNPQSRRVQKELAEPYEMHRTLMRSFSHLANNEIDRVLFRVDAHPRTGIPTVLLQSSKEPNLNWLREDNHKYLLTSLSDNPRVKRYSLHLSVRQRLVFRLRANPTVKRNKKRMGIVGEDAQQAWLERKAEQGGFRVLKVMITNEGYVTGYIRRGDKNHKLRLLSVKFDGLLQVNDPDLLLTTHRIGIGSGKGFGFGLLSLGPA